MANENDLSSKLKWTIRLMRQEDIDKCLIIWNRVELTEAKQTVAAALAADPEGFYVAELDKTGEVIGMCAGSMNQPDTAFMGFYAVEPEYQRFGIGRELWAKTIGRLDASINVGLYGVPSMSEKYKKSGFKVEDTTRMLIYESDAGLQHKLKSNLLKDFTDLPIGSSCRLEVVDGKMSESIFKKLLDYDHSIQRSQREKLLRLYLRGNNVPLALVIVGDRLNRQMQPAKHESGLQVERKSSCYARPSQESIIEDEALSTSTDASLSISTNNSPAELHFKSVSPVDIHSATPLQQQANDLEILGFGCIRHDNNQGAIIGPLYANSSDLCEILLKNLIARFHMKPGGVYSVMSLDSNKEAGNILSKLGLNEIDQCSRMFTKFVPSATLSKIYYVYSPNFTLF